MEVCSTTPLNDAELEKILEASGKAGARHAGYVLLRLPLELRQMFEDWLHTHYPNRARHVLSLVRQTRSGELNDSRFHHRFSGQGVYADLLARRFARAARQFGFDEVRTVQHVDAARQVGVARVATIVGRDNDPTNSLGLQQVNEIDQRAPSEHVLATGHGDGRIHEDLERDVYP